LHRIAQRRDLLERSAVKELDDLERATLAEAAKATTVSEMSTVATALKTIAEARAALSSELIGRRAYLLELIKSLSASLVPLVSLLALFATIVVQTKQIQATRQQTEDSEWRDLLSSLKGSSDAIYTDLTIAPRLTSFASSSTYGEQAKAIATRFMGHLSNPEGFQDLFSYVFPTVDSNNVHAILDVARSLTKSKRALENHCSSAVKDADVKDEGYVLSYCAEALDDKAYAQLALQDEMARKLASSRQSINDIGKENFYLSDKLSEFLHGQYRINTLNTISLDLSNVHIRADLSGMDLSHWNISNTIFDFVNLSKSDLTTSAFDGVEFRGTNWWDVRAISPNLLMYALQRWYPYYAQGVRYPVDADKDKYQQKVRDLCRLSNVTCPNDIIFGPQKPS
jgi:hypothetical protein